MKILIHSNAPWVPSGYGQQCATFATQASAEHDVAISAYYGLQGSRIQWQDCTVYPAGVTPFGTDVIRDHAENHFSGDPGLILTLLDVWVLKPDDLRKLPIASWVPLDHGDMPGVVWDYFTKSGAIPIAMSKFGQKQLMDSGFDALYVPHSVDTDVFKPLDKDECRSGIFPKDAFIVGMVAANQGTPSRKGFPEAFLALSRFMEVHTDVFVYLHTEVSGKRGQGVNLIKLAEQCGIPNTRIMEPNQYSYRTGMLSPDFLARRYNCCDVLLNPSLGEGFGIPIIEAQACGIPVIATNASAMTELVSSGWLVEGQEFYTGLGEFQVIPNVGEIRDALIMAYMQGGSGHDQSAVDFVDMNYKASDTYSDHWRPALEEIAERVRSKQIMELLPV